MMGDPKRIFQLLARAVDRLERLVLSVLVTGMVLLAALQILLRNIWHTGLNWAEPLLGMALLWLTLLGALAAAGLGRHLSIDLAAALLPRRGAAWLSRLMSLVSAVICVLLAWAAGRYVGFQREMDAGELLSIPLWKQYMAIPVVFWLIAIRFAIRALVPASWLIDPVPHEEGLPGEGRTPS